MAAMETLGSLFKITEVFLWDHGTVSADNLVDEPASSFTTDDIDSSINHIVDDHASVDDFELLAKEMDALGLPISFRTTKQKNNITTKGRRKGTCAKSVPANKVTENRVSGELRNFVLGDSSSRVLHDSTNIPLCGKTTAGNIGASDNDVYEGGVTGVLHLYRESVAVSAAMLGYIDEKHAGYPGSDVIMGRCVQDELLLCDPDQTTCAEVLMHTPGSDPDKFRVNDQEDAKSRSHKEQEIHKQALDNYSEDSSISCYITVANDVGDGIETLNLCTSPLVSSLSCSSADYVPDFSDTSICSEFADWKVIWDPFYRRNYFYNFKSQESTWYPPAGLEHFAFCSSISNANELSTDAAEEHTGMESACSAIQDIDMHGSHYITSPFQEKDVDLKFINDSSVEAISFRTSAGLATNFGTAHSSEHGILEKMADELVSHHTPCVADHIERTLDGIDVDLPANMVKYWCQRYSLFSQFDNGIKMDEEGWFSVTPESIARHHASRCGSGIIIDCFTGVGGNAIQFAKKCNHVIAIDIDPQKIDYARHNATMYGVGDHINFITSDFFRVAPRLKADIVFMSPPWGGPDYNKVQTYDLETMLRPHDGQYLFKIARMIASKVVMFLPRNVDLNQLAELSLSVDPPWALEVERNFLNGRLKAITAYFDNPS